MICTILRGLEYGSEFEAEMNQISGIRLYGDMYDTQRFQMPTVFKRIVNNIVYVKYLKIY